MLPFIDIFGKQIPMYGLLMAVALTLVFLLTYKDAKKESISIDDMFIVLGFVLLIGFPISSILYTLVTYSFSEIIAFIAEGNFAPFSGLVFYGALLGGILGGFVGTKVAKISFERFVRCAAPYIPLGHAIGRVGCVMAGCCNGMEYEGLFAIHYPHSVAGLDPEQGYFPVQLLEALINVIVCLILLKIRKKASTINLLVAYLSLYAIERFGLEFLRGDGVRGIHFGLSTSQWISLGILVVCILFVCFQKIKKRKKAS